MIKTLVYTYEKKRSVKKEFLNKLDSIWGNLIDIYVRDFWENSVLLCVWNGSCKWTTDGAQDRSGRVEGESSAHAATDWLTDRSNDRSELATWRAIWQRDCVTRMLPCVVETCSDLPREGRSRRSFPLSLQTDALSIVQGSLVICTTRTTAMR